ncbi:MAG: right-handed parallel beta-helix repeat-containing protein [Candidatus Syntrophosphaera sp.]|nr:right-handed parallel beta-helix repeat-containing protein [Candidatus Syntrophosphaera sp.]
MKHYLLLFSLLISGLILIPLNATDVSGNQSGTWTLVNSPYNIIGDVTVPVGSSLTIEPGVNIYAMGNYYLTVQGTLNAIGTEADTIRFKSGQADPDALWKGIRLENESLPSSISYCFIEKAEYGVNSVNSPVQITHNRFSHNQKALQIFAIGAADPADVLISENIIEWSIHNGIMINQNSDLVIENNEIRSNGTGTQYYAAIQLSNQSSDGSNSPLIQNNHIHHNFKQGITAWDLVGVNAIQPQILNNIIENNLTGIYLLNSSGYIADNIIRNNFIPGDANSGAGVMITGATSEPYFERNQIYGNFTGFYLGQNAKPCLGNLSIYHIWAQGENAIYNNIDETNTLHSIYTYSYTDPSIVIFAENNYWGTTNPTEIAESILDHNDNPSLPTVDFDPFLLTYNATTVSGQITYSGNFTLINHRLQIIGADSGDILAEEFINPETPFSYSSQLSEPFYVVVLANIADIDQTFYGTPGGLSQPQIFNPNPNNTVNVGNIEISETLPPIYQTIGTPTMIGTHNCYPLYHRFFVYHWYYINWLYEEGDYLYLARHERYNPSGNIIFNLPEETVWDKIHNLNTGDSWTRTEIIDEEGTQRQTSFQFRDVTEIGCIVDKSSPRDYFYSIIIQKDNATQAILTVKLLLSESDINRLYTYNEDGYAKRVDDISTNAETPYLQEGNWWEFDPIVPIYQPQWLCYDLEAFYEQSLNLYWQPPMADGIHQWTSYRIYNSYNQEIPQMIAEVPFSQTYWQSNISFNEHYILTVCAFDGNTESLPTNLIVVNPTAYNDPVATPPVLSIHPNPACFSVNQQVEIAIKSDVNLKGKINIYNIRGQVVKTIPLNAKGEFTYRWDGKDNKGTQCSSGIYFVKVKSKGLSNLQHKLVLMK